MTRLARRAPNQVEEGRSGDKKGGQRLSRCPPAKARSEAPGYWRFLRPNREPPKVMPPPRMSRARPAPNSTSAPVPGVETARTPVAAAEVVEVLATELVVVPDTLPLPLPVVEEVVEVVPEPLPLPVLDVLDVVPELLPVLVFEELDVRLEEVDVVPELLPVLAEPLPLPVVEVVDVVPEPLLLPVLEEVDVLSEMLPLPVLEVVVLLDTAAGQVWVRLKTVPPTTVEKASSSVAPAGAEATKNLWLLGSMTPVVAPVLKSTVGVPVKLVWLPGMTNTK